MAISIEEINNRFMDSAGEVEGNDLAALFRADVGYLLGKLAKTDQPVDCAITFDKWWNKNGEKHDPQSICPGLDASIVSTLKRQAAKAWKAALATKRKIGELAFEYLPGDEPMKLKDALSILERVEQRLQRDRHDSYEAVHKVAAIFRRATTSIEDGAPK